MVHHKMALLEDIESTPVQIDGAGGSYVYMLRGPSKAGYSNRNPRVFVQPQERTIGARRDALEMKLKTDQSFID